MNYKILSGVLGISLIISWVFFMWILGLGYEQIEMEYDCKQNCMEHEAYVYEFEFPFCYCYDNDYNTIDYYKMSE